MKNFDIRQSEIEFAIEAVLCALRVIREIQKEEAFLQISKQDASPVTAGDFAGQAIIGARLKKAFPGDPLVGEERPECLVAPGGNTVLQKITDAVKKAIPEATPEKICGWIERGSGEPSDRFWTVDPIDGTKGYLRGEQYAVALALILRGKVELGALACPHIDTHGAVQQEGPGGLFIAVRGQGAWASSLEKPKKWNRLKVSECKDIRKVRLLGSVEPSHTRQSRTEALIKKLGLENDLLKMDSQAKYAKVAAGGGEAFFYLVPKSKPGHRMKIWDVAPGSIIVEEAGGRLSDLEGKPLDFGAGIALARNPGIVVTNGYVHDDVLKTLQELDRSK